MSKQQFKTAADKNANSKKYNINFEKVAGSFSDNVQHVKRMVSQMEKALDAKGLEVQFTQNSTYVSVVASDGAVAEIRKTAGVFTVEESKPAQASAAVRCMSC